MGRGTWRAGWATLLVLAALLVGCAQQVDDIDRTQPNRVKKVDLEGVWYMAETVTAVPSTSIASFVGETSRTEKIRWVVQEELLLAYRSYPLLPGSHDVDGGVDYAAPGYTESPVAAFRIIKHFDIVRDYNSSTGEQTNVLNENDWDRPWYDREYIRVDWSLNLLTNFDFVSEWLATPIQTSYANPAEQGAPASIYFERDAKGELIYFDVPERLLVEADLYGCIISSPWYGWGTEDCATAEVEVVVAFARTEEVRDYEPLPYPDRELSRFGYFRSERYVYDPQRGPLQSNRSQLANRHNIWKASYEREADGSYLRNARGERVPIPLAEREVRTVPYYLSTTFPDDPLIVAAAEDTMAQWNVFGKEAAALAQGKQPSEVGDVFVVCHNPVRADDHEACGDEGFSPRPGDIRYSTLYWVEAVQQLGPLGYGPVISDPETGEIIAGRAFNYGEGMNTYSAYAVDVVRFVNGDIDGDDLKRLGHAREEVLERARGLTNLDRVSPRLKETRVGRVRDREPGRMELREQRRRQPRTFDRQAAEQKLERAREAGLGSMLGGGEEYKRALGASLGVAVDDLPPEVQAGLDPTRWLNPTSFKGARARRMRALRRSIDFADMFDPNVLGLARAYEGRTDYDAIWREIRAELFRATALHEVGHTLGLRHNFQASYDSMNYFDRYWELRQETMQPINTMFDMYAANTPTEAQLDGRMLEHQYSSIMDYGLTFNSDWKGLGKYDRAALVYAYSAGAKEAPAAGCEGEGAVLSAEGDRCLRRERGFVEVFAKKKGALGEAGEIMTSRDEYGFSFDDPTSVIVPYLERWHYTTVMQGFDSLQDAFDREWMQLDDYIDAREAAGDGDERPVRVPYLFCSDEWTEALLSCQVFDGGADPFEMTRNVINDYRSYYYFVNFKRDRLVWDPIDVLFRYFFYTFLPLSNYFQNWYLAPEGADEVMDNYWWLSINMGFNLIGETLATPPYGTFCESKDGRLFHLSDEPGQTRDQTSDYYLQVYCKPDGALFEVPQGVGRRRFSIYDVDSGYNYGFLPLEAGHYWTTLAAFWALVDPEAYVLGTDADVGTFAISFYDFFDQDIHHLVNAVVVENYPAYSPVMEITGETGEHKTGRLHYPVLSPVWDPDREVLFNPETGEAVEDATGPSGGSTAVCRPCSANAECNGFTGAIGGTFCQPIDDSGTLFCLQDCTDDEGLCDGDEVCDDAGNCVPEDGTCQGHTDRCGPAYPHGECPSGESCQDGACVARWPVVESDATFGLVDDIMFYGMLYTTFSFSTRYNDQFNVFKVGTGEEVVPGAGFEITSFIDPITGEEFGAVMESCGAENGAVGGSLGACEPCDASTECSGYTGFLGGAYCQPIEDGSEEFFCFQDCTDAPDICADGFTCDALGNCVPDGLSCDGRVEPCSASNPFGACDEGTTCFEGECVEPTQASPRCQYGLSETSGAAQMVLRGQAFVERYNTTLAAYWEDDGSDPEREAAVFREYSRARFDLENHVSKINVMRAVYAIFGKVY